jgi:hypothetical protein
MLSDEIRGRLEALNRQPLAPQARPATFQPGGIRPAGPGVLGAAAGQANGGTANFKSDSPLQTSAPPTSQPSAAPAAFSIQDSLWDARYACENASGKHFRICRPLTDFWPHGARELTAGQENLTARNGSAAMHPELEALAASFPRGTLLLDLETCGFAGSMVFLVGLIWHTGQELMLDQLLARDYAEERAILQSLWQVAARNQVLVTFNGKSFDWPMVHDRSTRHGLGATAGLSSSAETVGQPVNRDASSLSSGSALGPRDPRPELVHCDLLHHARRRWRRRLPDCKLQTLERFVCRRTRRDDVSGAQIPLAYHNFVRSGDARQLASILEHNALDLVTLIQVMFRIVAEEDRPPQ